MALTYSWKQFSDRLKRHINNDFPNAEYAVSDNEMLLYINEAMSFALVGQVWNGAKATGVMEVPEGYIMTFKLPALQKDTATGYWFSSLPQTPLSLPLGYSVLEGYFADEKNGRGKSWNWIKASRVGRRLNMPLQFGVRAWIENGKIYLAASDGASLYNHDAYVRMPSTRVTSMSDAMPLPDDAGKIVFDIVLTRLKDRLGVVQDVVKDDISAGNKSS